MSWLWENSLGDFLLVTLVLGGGAAYLTGRASALTWRSPLQALGYMVPLAFAVRFIHHALFHGSMLTLHYALVDLVVLLVFAALGFRVTRAGQMAEQYRWLYRRAGPLAWRASATTVGEATPKG